MGTSIDTTVTRAESERMSEVNERRERVREARRRWSFSRTYVAPIVVDGVVVNTAVGQSASCNPAPEAKSARVAVPCDRPPAPARKVRG